MGIFGRGEGYSREKYDEAANQEKKAVSELDPKPPTHTLIDIRRMALENPDTKRFLEERARQAHKKIQKLFEQGHKEAKGLNEEYDRLRAEVQDALSRLYDFEVNKLGLSVGKQFHRRSLDTIDKDVDHSVDALIKKRS